MVICNDNKYYAYYAFSPMKYLHVHFPTFLLFYFRPTFASPIPDT